MHIHTHAHTQTHAHTHTHAYTHTCTHTHMHTHTQTKYTYTKGETHKYTHNCKICTPSQSLAQKTSSFYDFYSFYTTHITLGKVILDKGLATIKLSKICPPPQPTKVKLPGVFRPYFVFSAPKCKNFTALVFFMFWRVCLFFKQRENKLRLKLCQAQV